MYNVRLITEKSINKFSLFKVKLDSLMLHTYPDHIISPSEMLPVKQGILDTLNFHDFNTSKQFMVWFIHGSQYSTSSKPYGLQYFHILFEFEILCF